MEDAESSGGYTSTQLGVDTEALRGGCTASTVTWRNLILHGRREDGVEAQVVGGG